LDIRKDEEGRDIPAPSAVDSVDELYNLPDEVHGCLAAQTGHVEQGMRHRIHIAELAIHLDILDELPLAKNKKDCVPGMKGAKRAWDVWVLIFLKCVVC